MTDATLPASLEAATPALSVVLVTLEAFETIRTTVRHLDAQTMANRMQLVIATPRPGDLHVPPEAVRRLGQVKVVGTGTFTTVCEAKAIALQHTLAPVVAFAEDHSFPEPEWAAALLEAHDQGYAAVMPEMINANPRTLLSWSSMFMDFSAAVETEAREVRYGSASHNTSYRRDALMELGDELPRRMLAELFLQDALHARGHRFYQQPAARTRHVQATRFGSWVRHGFTGGRLYGGLRFEFENWPLARRLFMVAASPLIPVLRLTRVIKEIRRTSHAERLLPAVLPFVILGLIIHAAGEATGYLLGIGETDLEYSLFEMARIHNTAVADHVAWA